MSGLPRRVLVTGATGGLGLALVAAFREAGLAVRATGRRREVGPRIEATGASFVPADLLDAGAADRLCVGMDSVVHAAALSSAWGEARAFQAVNVAATAGLLAAARAQGCSRFVLVSSPSVGAAFRDQVGVREDERPPGTPPGHYARTKLEAERLVLRGSREGFATVAVRPRALVGPDDRTLLPRLLGVARQGWMPLPRGGRALIELTDVRDAADAIRRAEDRAPAVAGSAIHVSGGAPLSVRALALEVAGALGVRLRLVPVPVGPARLAAIALEARAGRRVGSSEPPITRYALATLGFSLTFDMARARDSLGFAPRHDALATLLSVARQRWRQA